MTSLQSEEFKEKKLKAGEVLFLKGENCQFSFILQKGHVACFSLSPDKRVIPTFSVKQSGFIGEDNVFSEESEYRYYAVALEETFLVAIPNANIVQYLDSAGSWVKRIFFDLGEKVSKTSDVIVEHKIIDSRLNDGRLFTNQEEKIMIEAISGVRV